MTETLRVKHEHNIFGDFLEYLIFQVAFFEGRLEGTDQNLYEYNSNLPRLVSRFNEEGDELHDAALKYFGTAVLTPDQEEVIKWYKDELHKEIADVLILLAAVAMHAGLTPETLIEVTVAKLERNFKKYRPEHFEGRTVKEGMDYAREDWDNGLEIIRQEARRSNGHPRPGNIGSLEESQEHTVFTNGLNGSQG